MLCKHQVIGSIPIGSTTHSATRKRACYTSIYLEMKRTRILVVDTRWDGVKAPLPIFDIVNGFFKSIAVRRRFGTGSAGCKAGVERGELAVLTIKAE